MAGGERMSTSKSG